MRADTPRKGFVLIEVLIALIVLTIAGTALITLLGQSIRSMDRLARTERETQMAAAGLDRLASMGRREIDARIGRSSLGELSLDVYRVDEDLFAVSIAASDTSASLLRTVIYRPAE